MAATVRATDQFVGTGSVTSGVVPLPTGWQAGDVCYLFATSRSSSGGLTGPAGWTEVVASFNSGSSASSHMAVYRRVLVGGDSNPTVTCTSGRLTIISVAVQDADTATPEDVTVATDNQGATGSTSVIAPTLTPSTDPTLLLTGHGYGNSTTADLGTAVTPPSGMTEVNDVSTAEAAASDTGIEVSRLAVAGTGATGAQTATVTGGSVATAINGMAVSILVRSAGAALMPIHPRRMPLGA